MKKSKILTKVLPGVLAVCMLLLSACGNTGNTNPAESGNNPGNSGNQNNPSSPSAPTNDPSIMEGGAGFHRRVWAFSPWAAPG